MKQFTKPFAAFDTASPLRASAHALARIVVQCAVLAAIWSAADFLSRSFALPVPGGILGLIALLALLFSGGIAPRWVKAGADWLLADLLLFFIPAAVAAVQYGGLFRADGWRLGLVMILGSLIVIVATAVAVEQASRFERHIKRYLRRRGAAARLAEA
jgi:holin-like protein